MTAGRPYVWAACFFTWKRGDARLRVVVRTDLRVCHHRIAAAVQGTMRPPLGTPCRARGGPSPSPSSVCACLPNSTEAGRSEPRLAVVRSPHLGPSASAPCCLNTAAVRAGHPVLSLSVSRAAPSGGGWQCCRPSAQPGEEEDPPLTSSPGCSAGNGPSFSLPSLVLC